MSMAPKAANHNRNRSPCVNSCKRICDLPDDLLRRILGMLPLKDAVRTSVLSSRWEYLWTSLSDLVFDQYVCRDRMLFLRFVERAILFRDCSSVRVLSLRCALDNYDASRVDACLDAAIRRKVQDLKLELYSHMEPSVLPSSLFRCEMLTQLDLCFPDTLRVPPSARFPTLKVLTLEYVKFVDDISMGNMLSGAALERLSLDKCDWPGLGVLNISAPKLWSLSIREPRWDGDQSSNGNCKIAIHGPSLRYFHFSGRLLYDYSISGSSMPVEATVEVDYTAGSDLVDRWHRTLKMLLNVKTLTLRGLSLQKIDSLLHDALPVFRNLVTLKLSVGLMRLCSSTLAAILRRSPRLESLEFTTGLHVDHRLADGILDPPPPCFSSSLKRITIGAFFGTEAEMLALRILVRTAIVLEEMILCCPGGHSEGFDEYLIGDLAELECPEHFRFRLVRHVPTQGQEESEEEIQIV